MGREFVHACQLTSAAHQVVDLNALQVRNVPRTERVLIRNVLILVLDHVVAILDVMLETIVQYVAVAKVSLEIPSLSATLSHVSIIVIISFLYIRRNLITRTWYI
jgi:hypothetical protein